ncbi:MAG: 30S ribosomal protein S6 [Sedimentisphaerales bacterium]|nr:30S ribosomal protein S6 [Sedimentisphaerales bacterium]
METVTKKQMYEGMFLVDSAKAGSDWDGINAAIKKILERAEADIVSIRKWDDRRLAYEIQHVGRGTYILVYFRADGQKISGIEKAVQLSDHILRVLILNAEHMTTEDMEKETPAAKAEKEETNSGSSVEASEEDEEESRDDQEDEESADDEDVEEDTDDAEADEDDDLTDEDEESEPKTAMND